MLPFAEIVSVDPFADRMQPGPGAAFVVLVAFLLSFLAIRTSARLTRSVSGGPAVWRPTVASTSTTSSGASG